MKKKGTTCIRLLFNYKEEGSKFYVFHCINWEGKVKTSVVFFMYEGWNFNSGNYLFTTDTK